MEKKNILLSFPEVEIIYVVFLLNYYQKLLHLGVKVVIKTKKFTQIFLMNIYLLILIKILIKIKHTTNTTIHLKI